MTLLQTHRPRILALIAAGKSESSPQGFDRGGRIARKLGITAAQARAVLKRVAAGCAEGAA